MYYHGARYGAPWLCRWTSCDPRGVVDGYCIYSYCSCNPVVLHDPSGSTGTPPPTGLIGNNPAVGKLWEQAVVETLGPRLNAKSYEEVVNAYQAELAQKIATKGRGSNTEAGTGINYTRNSFKTVRSRFKTLLEEANFSLEGIQIHHAFGELAAAPEEALTTSNLMFVKGNAGTEGSGHNFAHQVSSARAVGSKNPGQDVAAKLRAAGVEPDVPELARANQTPPKPVSTPASVEAAASAPPTPTPTAAAEPIASSPKPSPAVTSVPLPGTATASPGRLARAAAWTAEAAPAALGVLGRVMTVSGALEEAHRTSVFERQHNRGELAAVLMGASTVVVGVAAGVVDDAYAAAQIAKMGAPILTVQSWEQYGSGPVQHAAGEGLRALLGGMFRLGL